ncbi:MAG: head-tail connector protein [Mangrovicoccus sp.]
MRLHEQAAVPVSSLPITLFKEHLRLGTGFSGDTVQDAVLESFLRAALSAIEARTGKALLSRTFIWRLPEWRSRDHQPMPLAPVNSLSWGKLVAKDNSETAVDLNDLALEPCSQRPILRSVKGYLPGIPDFGYFELGFDAGFSADWAGMPADLAQAVMLLAAYYYEHRSDVSANDGNMPFGVTSLIGRYRTVRILGGSAA